MHAVCALRKTDKTIVDTCTHSHPFFSFVVFVFGGDVTKKSLPNYSCAFAYMVYLSVAFYYLFAMHIYSIFSFVAAVQTLSFLARYSFFLSFVLLLRFLSLALLFVVRSRYKYFFSASLSFLLYSNYNCWVQTHILQFYRFIRHAAYGRFGYCIEEKDCIGDVWFWSK